MSNTHKSKPERGCLLVGAIILVGVSGLLLLGVALGESGLQNTSLPNWFIYSVVGVAIADIIAAVGLWFWKKWAYYLFLAATLISIGLGLAATGSILFAFSRIIPFAIVGYIILPKWEYFD